jgi:hypothetical protein
VTRCRPRGTNFYLADPNLEFVCATVMTAEELARARPHLVAMGEVASGELDTLAAVADELPGVADGLDLAHAATLRVGRAEGALPAGGDQHGLRRAPSG